jgi:hypothetical protein
MKKLSFFLLLFALVLPLPASAATQTSVKVPGGPRFWVQTVKRNESVTIRVEEYPVGGPNHGVFIGYIGNAFGFGHKVGTLTSGLGEEFILTVPIPNAFRDEVVLGIQVRNNATGARAYTMFQNTTNWSPWQGLSLSPLGSSSSQSDGISAGIPPFGQPTFWIQDMVQFKRVTVRFFRTPPTEKYRVTIGRANDGNFGLGHTVGNFQKGGNFTMTFDLPPALQEVKELALRVTEVSTGNYSYTQFTNSNDPEVIFAPAPPSGVLGSPDGPTYVPIGLPGSNILAVVQNSEVTVRVFNFPPNAEVLVRMGPIGTQAIGGTFVGLAETGPGGVFLNSFPIPANLHGQGQIAIRFESSESKHFAYNYFDNVDGGVPEGGGAPVPSGGGHTPLPPGVIPTISTTSVIPDVSVTISTQNFPAGDTFNVTMGPFGSLGIGGTLVATQESGAGGTLTATYNIPASLAGSAQIAIRLQSPFSGYFAYTFFDNQ